MKNLTIKNLTKPLYLKEPVNLLIDGHINYGIVLYPACEGSTVKQTKNGLVKALDVRANHVLVDGLNFKEKGIRLRFGASNCTIVNNNLIREKKDIVPFDVVGIQIKGGAGEPCINNTIINNTIINYSDGIQLTDFADSHCAGTIITENTIGATENIEGIENAIDLKVGGKMMSPVEIFNNFIFGYKKNIDGRFGYALTLHKIADYIIVRDNHFHSCDSAFHLTRQFRGDRQVYIPKLYFYDNLFSDVEKIFRSNAPELIRKYIDV